MVIYLDAIVTDDATTIYFREENGRAVVTGVQAHNGRRMRPTTEQARKWARYVEGNLSMYGDHYARILDAENGQ